MKVSKYLLISTDGYSIDTKDYSTLEEAEAAMKKAYDELSPQENNCKEDCWINKNSAILFANGENVYVWDIQKVEIEVDLQKANQEFVTKFMYEELRSNYDFEEDVSEDEIHSIAELAFDIYCDGEGQTEYECIEEAYDNWVLDRQEDMEF